MFVNKNAPSHKCLLHNLYHQIPLFLISYHLLQERVKEASSQRL